ncbi:esterase-like activity of phytase family protein [Niveispirillum sp. BGYR6]|uniref:esterase-like activity of phytase family protein n=1 Tax=Niveispirillum sp. BGYR6 TaxID=2971249 RepID=UPI0022B9843C|nr:esterase-like activity of phytase family protein [Niveispirillum sp. BGYR6]MDG5493403.1 esterase-like activity of phytase family protein [Niveispirillum sp. BGYR6]
MFRLCYLAGWLLAAPLGLTGCATGDTRPHGVPVQLVETEPAAIQPERVGELVFKGAVALQEGRKTVGGLSSLRVSPDGRQFIAISDRGDKVAGRLSYRPDGTLTGMDDLIKAPLLESDGSALQGGKNDTESLAMIGPWPGDGWVVGFEREHRLLRYGPALAGVKPVPLDGPAGLKELDFNAGLETALMLADNRLLLIAEGEAAGAPGLHRAWVGRSGNWVEFRYQGHPPFLPVDAANLPDGGILVLERRVGMLGGWGSRIVHIDAKALAVGTMAGATLAGREIARLDPPLLTENFEGIDVRPAKDGRVFIHIISDDNFFVLQRTVMMMFEWKP